MTQPREQASAPISLWAQLGSGGELQRTPFLRSNAAAVGAIALGLLIAIVCLRSWIFVWFSQSSFDADQAVFGLMGKDIAEGRAYPLFTYGRRYMLAVGAWLCAPLFAAFGVSVTTLKLPMLAMNLGCVVMLWLGLRKERALGTWGTSLAILPFAATSVVTSSRLLEHAGGNIEPFFFLMLAFFARGHAVLLGLVFGIGFLNREFAAIGLIALLMMDVVQRRLHKRAKLYGIALAVAAIVVCGARWLAEGTANYYGPTPTMELQYVLDGRGFAHYIQTQLPLLLGSGRIELDHFIVSRLHAGKDWLRYVVLAWAFLGVLGMSRLKRTDLGGMSTYLFLIGLGQLSAFVLFCGTPWDPMLIRYVLLTLCLWIGLTAFAWKTPALRPWIALVIVIIGFCNLRDHVRVAREYLRDPPQSENEQIARELVRRDVKYARADFWIAYVVAFLTDERVIASPCRGCGERMGRYLDLLKEHRDEVVTVQREPCRNAGKPVQGYYLCPPKRNRHRSH